MLMNLVDTCRFTGLTFLNEYSSSKSMNLPITVLPLSKRRNGKRRKIYGQGHKRHMNRIKGFGGENIWGRNPQRRRNREKIEGQNSREPDVGKVV